MIPNRDIYADKNGKITDDPRQYAFQVAVAGVNLDERVAKRYGIGDMLVSVDEPNAPRRMKGKASVEIVRADEKEEEKEEKQTEPEPKPEKAKAEAAESKASVKVEKAVAVKKPAAKKGEKKK